MITSLMLYFSKYAIFKKMYINKRYFMNISKIIPTTLVFLSVFNTVSVYA